MSGHARHIPEANLAIVHAVCQLQPALSPNHQTHTILLSESCRPCRQRIQLKPSSLSRRPWSLAVALHARSHSLAEVHMGLHIQSL